MPAVMMRAALLLVMAAWTLSSVASVHAAPRKKAAPADTAEEPATPRRKPARKVEDEEAAGPREVEEEPARREEPRGASDDVEKPAARNEPAETARVEPAPAPAVAVTPVPAWSGITFEALAGASAVPSALTPFRTTWDRFWGFRGGYRRPVWKGVTVGGEAAWRTTLLAHAGNQPTWPGALLARMGGAFPHQVIRWQNQLTAVGTVGWRYDRMGFFVEPSAQLGLGASWRQVAVHLDGILPYNRSLLTAGPLVGASLLAGIKPLFWRWDFMASSELGPPPFTARYHALQFNMSLGMML